LGIALQRLFSTFPRSWPGFGLLLLRCCLGIALIHSGIAGFSAGSGPGILTLRLGGIVGGIVLFAGLWTPLMATLIALDQGLIALSLQFSEHQDTWIHVFLAVVSASVAMLGPGAWSIDARMFGRRRIDLDSRGKRPSL
jgi:uncharacterized membrane protein YphA (DoxX/SURF4 family)